MTQLIDVTGHNVDEKGFFCFMRCMSSPFGVFSIVYNGQLLSYHYLTKDQFKVKLEKIQA